MSFLSSAQLRFDLFYNYHVAPGASAGLNPNPARTGVGCLWFALAAPEPHAQVDGKLRPTERWFSRRKPKPHLEKKIQIKKKPVCMFLYSLHWPEPMLRYMQIIA